MAKIENISARSILTSNGTPTIETKIATDSGQSAAASVPAGVSTSPFEARVVPVEEAIKNVEMLNSELKGMDPTDLFSVDQKMIEIDGTKNKERLGGNTLLSVSIAACRLGSLLKDEDLFRYIGQLLFREEAERRYKLPQMMVLLLEGGKHGSGKLNIQEFSYISTGISKGREQYEAVKQKLAESGQSISVGLEGGFTPYDMTDEEALDFLYKIVGDGNLALDIATESNSQKDYDFGMMTQKYGLVSLEDPYDLGDSDAWVKLTCDLGKNMMIVADDLTASNSERIVMAAQNKMANSVVIKPNQIGTITETLGAVRTARENDFSVVVSHRGQETNDDFIADLAVGVGADYVKFGGFSHGERMAKYNRLLAIEDIIDRSQP